MLFSVTVAVVFPRIEAVLGLIGATCSVSLTFVIPVLLYLHQVGLHRSDYHLVSVAVDPATEHLDTASDGNDSSVEMTMEMTELPTPVGDEPGSLSAGGVA